MPNTRVALAITIALTVGACAFTQPQPPKTDLPPPTATAAPSALLERWWVAFDDPVLTQLVDEALAENLDLRASLARIEAARSQVLLAQSNLAPSIDLRVDPTRSRISGVGSQPLPPGTPLISNDFRVAIEMSYELDVWGKYRAGVLAARNDLVAARYYREAVRFSVAAEVANSYFRLRAADAELKLLDDTLRLRTETLNLQRDRFEGGLIGEYELRTSEAERSAVVADIARARNAIEQLSAAVAVLTGRSPRLVFNPEIARGATIDAVTAVPLLPDGLPAGLLERRPDIRRSEALLASSDLKIQQARANYYPSLTLGLSYGSQAAATGNLFSAPAAIWSLGLGLLQPLLALRAIDAQVALARAGNDLAAVEYLQTVQIAFREVHDALAANRSARDVLAAETDRRNQIAKAFEVAQLRYDAGRTSFLEVIDAQRTLLAAETLRIAAARDARLSIVAFAKSLGGGWNPEQIAAVQAGQWISAPPTAR